MCRSSRATVNDALNEAFKESRLLNLQLQEEREKVQCLTDYIEYIH